MSIVSDLFKMVHHTGEEIPTIFEYRCRDPYTVTIVFCPGMPNEVVWRISRDVLAWGLQIGADGVGDVRVSVHDGGNVHIKLDSPCGHAKFITTVDELGAFLARTFQLVPWGSESQHIDIDKAIEDFFAVEEIWNGSED